MSSDQVDRDTDEIVAAVKDELADERFLGDKVLVSRRELVGVAAGSATVAGLLGHETGTASAQSGGGTGRLGDPTPLEYVGTDSLDTDELGAGQTPVNRPFISNGEQTVYVDPVNGSDTNDGTETTPLATIQEAVDRCPIYLRHQYTIDLTTAPTLPVTYDEDVLINSVTGTGMAHQGSGTGGGSQKGPVINLHIVGDAATPSNVEVGSITVGNCTGVSTPRIEGMRLLRETPYYEALQAIAVYGTGEAQFFDLEFAANGIYRGLLAYGSKVNCRRVDVTNTDIGIAAKRGGHVEALDALGSSGIPYSATTFSHLAFRGNSASATDRLVNTGQASTVYDGDTDREYRNSARALNRVSIATYEDTGTATVFDFDTGVISDPPDMYTVVVDLFDATGNATGGLLGLQLNGVSTMDYYYYDVSGTANSDQTEFGLGNLSEANRATTTLTISGGNPVANENTKPAVGQNGTAGVGGGAMTSGRMMSAYSAVDQIRLFTASEAVGRVDVYGYNFGWS